MVKSTYQAFPALMDEGCIMSRIGAVVKVVDSHLCGWSSIPSKSCSFFQVTCMGVNMLDSWCVDEIFLLPLYSWKYITELATG